MPPYPAILNTQQRDLLWALMDFPFTAPEITCTLNVRSVGTPFVTFRPARYASFSTLAAFTPACVRSSYLCAQRQVVPASTYQAAVRDLQHAPVAPVPSLVHIAQQGVMNDPSFTTLKDRLKRLRKELKEHPGAATYVNADGTVEFTLECPAVLTGAITREFEEHVGAPVAVRHLVTLAGASDATTTLTVRNAAGQFLYSGSTLQARRDVPRLLTAMQNRSQHARQRQNFSALSQATLVTVLPLHP